MSIGISIQFLTGRYHATPWNHQVNEGIVEFPPSPWRILRALVSAYHRQSEKPPRHELLNLVTALSSQLPCYWLPEYTSAHTRHYMPVCKKGKPTTTKVIDTWIAFPGGALSSEAKIQVVWQNVEAKEPQLSLLQQLCRHINYLGRAESWVEIRLIEDLENLDFNCVPASNSNQFDAWERTEKTPVLVPFSPEEMAGFQAGLAVLPKPKKGKSYWTAPDDILAALELDVGKLHAQAWNGIPGTRWAIYLTNVNFNPQPSINPNSQPSSISFADKSEDKLPNFALIALDSKVLPDITETVSLCSRVRQALIKISDGASVFTGRNCSKNNEPVYLQGHKHAWYLPEVNRQGKIQHIAIYAKMGFDQHAIASLAKLRKLTRVYAAQGYDVQTILLSLGNLEDYAHQNQRNRVIGYSRKWQTLTPVILTRHPKFRRNGYPKYISDTSKQLDGTEHQALKLLTQLPDLGISLDDKKFREQGNWLSLQASNDELIVKVRCCSKGITNYNWQKFRRQRDSGNGRKSLDNGYWLEIEFSQEKLGPIALGYGAHFGLGTFVSIE